MRLLQKRLLKCINNQKLTTSSYALNGLLSDTNDVQTTINIFFNETNKYYRISKEQITKLYHFAYSQSEKKDLNDIIIEFCNLMDLFKPIIPKKKMTKSDKKIQANSISNTINLILESSEDHGLDTWDIFGTFLESLNPFLIDVFYDYSWNKNF